MTQYNSLNVKLSNSQLNKLKSAIKNEIEVVLRLSLNTGDSNDEANFPHELLLTDRQISSIRKAFSNNSSADIKFSKTQLSKIRQSGGFLGKLLGPLLKTGLPLIKSVIKPLAKSVLIPLGLTAAASAADTGIHKKMLGSGNTTLIISNKDIEDLIKIVKSLEDSALLLKGITESIQNEVKEQKGGFLSIFLGTLGASLLGNLLTRKGINKKCKGINRAGEGIVRAGEGNLLSPHPLTNFEIQKYYQNEPKFNGVFSRDNLPNKIKDGPYTINLDQYSDIGTHWISLYVKNITYFDSFGVEHVPKEIKKFIDRPLPSASLSKNVILNIFRIHVYDSILCGYFCIGFINFMFTCKSLTDYTNIFSPNNFKKNDDIILNYFKDE